MGSYSDSWGNYQRLGSIFKIKPVKEVRKLHQNRTERLFMFIHQVLGSVIEIGVNPVTYQETWSYFLSRDVTVGIWTTTAHSIFWIIIGTSSDISGTIKIYLHCLKLVKLRLSMGPLSAHLPVLAPLSKHPINPHTIDRKTRKTTLFPNPQPHPSNITSTSTPPVRLQTSQNVSHKHHLT